MKFQDKSKIFSIFEKQRSSLWFYLAILSITITFTTWLIIGNKTKTCACASGLAAAKSYIGSMNRAQQVLYLEKKLFASSLDELNQLQGLSIPVETKSYQYAVKATDSAAFHYAIARKESDNKKIPRYKSLVGATFISGDNSKILGILCQSDNSGSLLLPEPTIKNNVPICATGTSALGYSNYELKKEDNYQ